MRSQMVPGDESIDLSNCDREPIHTPGAIQPHAALLAVDRPTDRILAASGNVEAFLGVAHDNILNARLTDVFRVSNADAVRAASYSADAATSRIIVPLSSAEHVALVHTVGETVYVEIDARPDAQTAVIAKTRDGANAFASAGDVDELCAIAARRIRDLVGYDRVMIYRFDVDGHGKIVAEDQNGQLESYLGRHYPASDIPRQARALYRTTMVRLIVDVDYAPVPVEPALDPRSGEPWDLGRAVSRSVSPIHVQYLKNMGVAATLTISLMRDGELWGLVACHHYSPRFIDFDSRAAAETLGYALASRAAQLEDADTSRRTIDAHGAVLDFATRVRSGLSRFVRDRELHRRLGIDGAALFAAGDVVVSGRVPDADRLAELAAWVRGRSGDERFVTNALAKLNPSFEDVAAVASGVYARSNGEDVVIALRGEHRETIGWGGDPNKPVMKEGERLTPRGSFALWQEEVRFRALPWEPWTLDAIDRAIQIAQASGDIAAPNA